MLERLKRIAVPLRFRSRESFDKDWRFRLEQAGGTARLGEGGRSPEKCLPGAGQPFAEDYDDSDFRVLTVPHDWSIEGSFDEEADTGGAGAYLPAGIGWYRKRFVLDGADMDKRIFLEFGGVMSNSTVYVNGNCVGHRPYGYASFCYDLTDYVREGVNVVAVKVDNHLQPSSRWYAGAGIYRHMYLVKTDKAHIPYSGIYVTTPEVQESDAIVEVRCEVKNDYPEMRDLEVLTEILDAEGKVAAYDKSCHGGENADKSCHNGENVVASCKTRRGVKPGETFSFHQRLQVTNPKLWSPDEPVLYRARCTVICDGEKLDDMGTSFGIRKLGYSLTEGFTVNGEKTLIKGLCMHQNMGCMGIAVPERLLEETLLKLKKAGCNGIRLSHYPHPVEMLDLLDTIGFIAIGEAFDEWEICRPKTADVGTDGGEGESDYGYAQYFREWHDRDLTDFLRRDRNHPCIAFWSIGNEIFEQNYPEGGPMAREIVDKVHALDPTRPVTAACCNTSGMDKLTTTDAYMEALDIIGINYVDHWGDNKETYYFQLHEKFPDKVILGNEHVSPGGIRGKFDLYEHENCWYTTYYNKMIDVEQRHKFLAMHPYVLGDYMWTGIDYLGEAPWPSITPCTGMLDTCGFEKDGYELLHSIWQDEEVVLKLFPHWNYEGHEEEAIPVICYTNCDYVELFLNGQSYGTQSWQFPRPGMTENFFHFSKPRLEITTSDLHLMWMVPYRPGQIKAVGYKGDEVVATVVVNTSGAAAKLDVTATAKEICADGQDACKVAVRITDKDGNLVPHASDRVFIKVEGAGELWGVDNGSPFVGEGYRRDDKEAFNGMMCAVVRSNGEKGEIRVTARTEFAEETITIRCL